jgi:hypothetical protein
MRLKLRSKRLSPFAALVAEAVAVTERLRALDADPAQAKLTASAFLRECMKLDENITDKSLRKLRNALDRNPPALTNANASLRRMVTALRGPHLPRPPTAKYLDRSVRWLNTASGVAELTKFGSGTLELLCCAVQVAGEKYPEAFGKRTSSAEIDAERAQLTAKRDELYFRIGSEATAADLFIDDTAAKPVAFALAPSVTLAPKSSAGERLCNFLIDQKRIAASRPMSPAPEHVEQPNV